MNIRGFICALLATMGLGMMCPVVGFAQNSAVRWYAFDAGLGVSSSSTTSLKSAVGQTFVGTSRQ